MGWGWVGVQPAPFRRQSSWDGAWGWAMMSQEPTNLIGLHFHCSDNPQIEEHISTATSPKPHCNGHRQRRHKYAGAAGRYMRIAVLVCRSLTSDHLKAGAAAAFAVDALVYPLDTIKTRYQSQQYLTRSRAATKVPGSLFRGVYQGIGSVVVATLPAG